LVGNKLKAVRKRSNLSWCVCTLVDTKTNTKD
jgi:hypothetical protein